MKKIVASVLLVLSILAVAAIANAEHGGIVTTSVTARSAQVLR